jgi:hypothetical protein
MPSLSNYREFSPRASLKGDAEGFRSSAANRHPMSSSFHRVFPEGGVDLLFDFTAVGNRRAPVVGTMSPG